MRKSFFIFFVLVLLFFSSCATNITTNVMRPAELDLNGAKSLAVLPFQTNPWNNQALDVLDFFISPINESLDKRWICNDLTEWLTNGLVNSHYMDVVNASAVKSAIEMGREIPCDIYLSGYISFYDEKIERHEFEKDDKITIKYSKEVWVGIVYEIIDAKTNRIVSHESKRFSGEFYYEKNVKDLPSGYNIVKSQLKSFSQEIMRKIQPYTVSVTFSLLADKTKDPQIKQAHELVKNKDILEAKNMFLDLYDRTGVFACGYNAAILMSVLRYYDQAEEMMMSLYLKTSDKRARKALQKIRTEKQYAKKLSAQEAARRDTVEYEDDFDW